MSYGGSPERRRRKKREAQQRYRKRHPERVRQGDRGRWRRWAKENPERLRRTRRKYAEQNPEKIRRWSRKYYLRKRYGIDVETYERMLKYGNGGCWLCGSKQPGQNKQYFHIDHDHTTGQVRGLLCIVCNSNIIGQMEKRGVTPKALSCYLSGKKAKAFRIVQMC